jgi:hypothetical protein
MCSVLTYCIWFDCNCSAHEHPAHAESMTAKATVAPCVTEQQGLSALGRTHLYTIM